MGGVIDVALRKDSLESRKRILSACVKLFIEKGYSSTTMAEIVSEANVSNSTFQNLFRSKSGVLMDLVEFMFRNQFGITRKIVDEGEMPALVYAVETAIQMTLTELNENLREIYVEAYTNAATADYIAQKTSAELHKIFGVYMPECSESDFYELDIGTGGMMRGYMERPCDQYFTLEKKLERFLTMTLKTYCVPEKDIETIIAFVLKTDIRMVANKVMKKLFSELAMQFEFELDETKKEDAV